MIKTGDTKEVFAVYTNSDLTEGRGSQYIEFFCECEATAIRKAHGNYIQGLNSPIKKITVEFDLEKGGWIGPVRILKPSPDDIEKQKKIDYENELKRKYLEVVNKAKEAGLSDVDVKILQDGMKL